MTTRPCPRSRTRLHALAVTAAAALAAALLAGAPGAAAAAPVPVQAPASASAPAEPLDTATALMQVEHLGIRAARLEHGEHLRIDGRLSEAAWARAPVYDRFVEKEPVTGAAPKYGTQVQVLFDEHALYVGITAFDDHPSEIRAPLVRHDGVLRTQDFVVVYVDSIGKRQAAQWFRVSASGSTADGLNTAADDDEDFAPDYDFDAAAARNARGWTAELRIPFSSLRFSSDAHAGWRIMVARRMPRDQDYLWTSVPVPMDAPDFIATMQPLEGLVPPSHPSFLQVRPSVTLRQSRERDLGAPATRDNALDPSLDVKWHPMPELVMDGTWRPDFSQVALDVPQLSGNSSFALYLPEKRPFFFESADLLRTPSDAFYTRSFTAPQWGLRGTWRGQAVAGTAMLIDDRGGGETLLPGAYGTGTATQPGSRSFTSHAGADLGDGGLSVGALVSVRRYDQGRGDNDVAGPDLTWQATPQVNLRAQWLHSRTSAQPDAQGSLSRGASAAGDYVVLKAARQTDRTSVEADFFDISPQYRHDSGFVPQVGVRELDLHQGIAFRQVGPINELWLKLSESQVRDRENRDVVQEYVTPAFWLGASHNVQASLQYRGISKVRTWQGAPLSSEHYWHGKLSFTAMREVPQVDIGLDLGRMADYTGGGVRPGGKLDLSVKTRPLARLELEPSVWYAWLADGPHLQYREAASQLLGVWHFDARQNLRVILQRYTYDYKPDTRDSRLVASLTYTYRRSMGTVLYAGWTSGHELACPVGGGTPGVCVHGTGQPGLEGTLTRGSEVFVKLQADMDEVMHLF